MPSSIREVTGGFINQFGTWKQTREEHEIVEFRKEVEYLLVSHDEEGYKYCNSKNFNKLSLETLKAIKRDTDAL